MNIESMNIVNTDNKDDHLTYCDLKKAFEKLLFQAGIPKTEKMSSTICEESYEMNLSWHGGKVTLRGDGEVIFELLPKSTKLIIEMNKQVEKISELREGLLRFTCQNCPNVTKITRFPSTLTSIELINVNIETLPELPNGLKELLIEGTQIKNLPSLPDSLESLYIQSEHITQLPKLPNLKHFTCVCDKLEQFPKLPKTLTYICVEKGSRVDEFPFL